MYSKIYMSEERRCNLLAESWYNQSALDGMRSSYPICLAIALLFFSLGTLANLGGLSLAQAVVMTMGIFAAPLQAFIIDNQDISIWATVVNSVILNFKFLLMSAALVPLWPKLNIRSLPALHLITSSIYMVCNSHRNIKDPWSFYLGLAVPCYITATLATILGYLTWTMAADYQPFLSALARIVLPVHFVCLTIKRKGERTILIATLLGLIMSLFLSPLVGKHLLIIVWLFTSFLILTMEERICGQ